MSINNIDRGDSYGKMRWELVCDKCGHHPIRDDSYAECVKYAKANNWKSKSIRTTDAFKRYIWSHLCPFCNQTEWKKVEVKT